MTPTDSDPTVAGLVLAGGRSTRFGDADANKAVATVGRRTLLERVVDAIAVATSSSPIVAVRSVDQRQAYADILSDRDVTFVLDDGGFEGPLAGIFGASGAIDASWFFCCGCDMPLLSPAAIQWLIGELGDQIRQSTTRPAAVAIRDREGHCNPLHTLYRTSAIETRRDDLRPTAGPRALLALLDAVRTVPVRAAPDAVPIDASLTNVNTRTDLRTAVSRTVTE